MGRAKGPPAATTAVPAKVGGPPEAVVGVTGDALGPPHMGAHTRSTPIHARVMSLWCALERWNYPIPQHSCCYWHAALMELAKTAAYAKRNCAPEFQHVKA